MNKGASGALALILLWIAFTSFFVAFHPGGIRDPMFIDKTNNPQGYARNPAQVLTWMIKRAVSGGPGAAASTATTTAAPDIAAVAV